MTTILKKRSIVYESTFIFISLLTIYLIPTLSHIVKYPIYLFEPMRFVLIIGIAFFNRRISYLLAITMPMFSFLISSHPVFIKVLLISIELSLNVYLFYLLNRVLRNVFFSSFISIITSKLVYYSLKYLLIVSMVFSSNLISTPLIIQLITSIVFSTIIVLVIYFRTRREKTLMNNQ